MYTIDILTEDTQKDAFRALKIITNNDLRLDKNRLKIRKIDISFARDEILAALFDRKRQVENE